MTGLDKMINQILEEANKEADQKKQEAQGQADAIMQDAKAKAAKISEEISKQAEVDAKNYQERIKSSADLARRTAILQAKQDVISEVIEKAYQSFCAKSDAEYFRVVKAILTEYALAEEGEIYFSQKDLDRMPDGFAAEINKVAEGKGGKLTLAKETRQLEGGFILAYGGIEENCSFKAMFDAKRDELQDQVQHILFS